MTQQPQQDWNPSRVAGNTLVVILTIVGLFCVLPALVCGLFSALGLLSSPS